MNDTELAERVAVALEAKAAEVKRPRRGFDPAGRNVVPFSEPGVGTLGRSGGRKRWRALAAAAAVLAVMTAGGVIVSSQDGGSGGTETDATASSEEDEVAGDPVSSGTPDGLLAPTWVPDGLQPWDVSWRHGKAPDMAEGRAQLFLGSGDEAARVLVEIDPVLPAPEGEQVDVRRQTGFWFSDVDGGGVFWEERGASLVASSRGGMSKEGLIAFVNSLDRRSEDLWEGFAPPDGSALSLVAEAEGPVGIGGGERRFGSYIYGYGEPTGSVDGFGAVRELAITTSVPVGDSAGTVSRDYLNGWFNDERDEDGMVTVDHSPGIPGIAALQVLGPDGSEVFIDTLHKDLDEGDVRQIADSISPVSGEEFDNLRQAVSDVFAAMPVVASAQLPSATLSVRGRDEFRALCIDLDEADAHCSAEEPFVKHADGRLMSLRVGGDWYVAAASPEEPPRITKGTVSDDAVADAIANYEDLSQEELERIADDLAESQGGSPEELTLDSETAVDDEWRFALAVAPADVDDVTVWFGTGYGGLSRSSSLAT